MMPLVSPSQDQDTVYIQHFPDTLNLRLQWANKGLNLRVNTMQGDSSFFYGPRYRHYAGFGGFLWNIGFSFLIPLPQSLQHDQIKRFDFQGALFAKYWLLDGIYQRYQGYYISSISQGLRDKSDYFNSGLLARKVQATITYLPGGDQLSLRAPFNQGVRQVRSAGSFLLSGGFSYVKLQGESGILPPTWLAQDEPALSSIRLASITSLVGYACTLVHRSFFIHLYGLTGIGFQQKRYEQGQVNNVFSLKPIYKGRAAIGYDNGQFYAGVYGLSDYASFQVEQWYFHELSSQVRVFIGIRFTEPGFIQKIKPRFLEKLQNSPNIPLPPIFG